MKSDNIARDHHADVTLVTTPIWLEVLGDMA